MKRKQKENEHSLTSTILAFDPSLRGWGYVIINPVDSSIVEADCIKTENESKKRRIRKGDDTVRRVSEINRRLISVLKSNNIRLIVSELPHGSQSAKSAQMIGIVTGIVQTITDCFELPIEWYSEADAKKALSNKQSLSKDQTIAGIDGLYTMPWTGVKFCDEAIADATAIYHAAQKSSNVIKFMK